MSLDTLYMGVHGVDDCGDLSLHVLTLDLTSWKSDSLLKLP